MPRRFSVAALLVACLLQWSSASAPAAEDILNLVPNSALGFVVVNGAAEVDAKLQAIARHFPGQMPSPLFMLKLQSGIQEGLDEKAAVAIVALPPSGTDPMPTPLVLVPVADFDKFIGQLSPEKSDGDIQKVKLFNSPSLVRHIGGYAAITEGNRRETLEKLAVASDVPAALAPWRAWVAGQDVAVVVTQPGIKMISAKVQAQIATLKDTMAMMGAQTAQAGAGLDLYAKLFKAAEKEVAVFGLALKIDKQNAVHLTKRAALVPEGSWAKIVADLKPMKENPLAGMPDEPFIVAGGVTVSDEAWEQLMKLSVSVMKSMPAVYGLSDEQAEKLSKIPQLPPMGIRSMSMMMGVARKGDPLYANMIGVMRVDDDEKFLAGYEKYMRDYAEALKGIDSPMLAAPEVEKAEIDGASGLLVTIKMPKAADEVVVLQTRLMEAMVGPGGKLLTWLAPADKQNVVMGFVNKNRLERTMEAIQRKKPGLAGNADVKKTAALLPSDALAVGYASPRGAIEFFKQWTAQIAPPGAMPAMPEFATTPPVGFAVMTRPNEIEACMVLPAEVVQEIGAFASKVAAMHGGDGAVEPFGDESE